MMDRFRKLQHSWVLDILDEYKAKATFFVVGDNVKKNPEIFEQLKLKGHAAGNHSYNHLNGWKTKNENYFENIERCDKLIHSKLFRPPYGKLKPSQYLLLNTQYQIIMWDVLAGDFDHKITKEKCLENVLKNAREGSVGIISRQFKSKRKNAICFAIIFGTLYEKRIFF